MGVRCTLLGHEYGDAEIEREREERGEEAVVTIREVKTCARCGNRSVVSENKEVTSVAEPGDGPEAASGPGAGSAMEPDSEESVVTDTDAESPRDAGPETDAGPQADAGPDEAAGGPEHDPETDDGVILEDEPEPPAEREYGEWPDADEDHASAEADPAAADSGEEPAAWPDSDEDADEGYDAAPPQDEPAPDVDYPGSADAGQVEADEPANPDEPADSGELIDEEPASETPPADDGADFERAHEAGSPSRPTTGETELYCPACGYRDPSRDGSLREGDICPECKKGYLAAGE